MRRFLRRSMLLAIRNDAWDEHLESQSIKHRRLGEPPHKHKSRPFICYHACSNPK